MELNWRNLSLMFLNSPGKYHWLSEGRFIFNAQKSHMDIGCI